MIELEEGDKLVFEQQMDIEPEDTVLRRGF